MKQFFFLAIILLLGCTQGSDCGSLPTRFKSYNEAENLISSASFVFKDSCNTSKSSWIRSLHYYSCDKQTGYLVMSTDSKEYIHQGVPISLWKEFKKANSFGSFYTSRIKGRYQLKIE